jgi:SPP1 gp7 family putative phage head morphogenesis protein
VPSKLYNSVQAKRTLLLQREEASALEMVSLYSESYTRIDFLMQEVLGEVVAIRRSGKTPTPGQVQRLDRYQLLLGHVQAEMEHFAEFSDSVIAQEQLKAVMQAAVDSSELITEALGPVPATARLPENFNRFKPANVQELVGRLSNGSPTRSLLNQIPGDALGVFRGEFVQGIVQGLSPREVARRVSESLDGVSRKRALVISRTEVLGAYREATIESYRQRSKVVKKWRWTASRNSRTCPMCLAMDGKLFDLEVPFGSHPNCRCTPVPITPSWEELGFTGLPDTRPQIESGAEWFSKQKPAVQRKILGAGRYERFKDGDLTLEDCIGYRDDPEWGPNRWTRSLIQIDNGRFKHPPHALSA